MRDLPRSPRHAALAAALALALAPFAQAAAQQVTGDQKTQPPSSDTRHPAEDSHIKDLGGLVVTASALQDTAETLSKPTDVLAGARLDENRAASLGETVASVPGVQSS